MREIHVEVEAAVCYICWSLQCKMLPTREMRDWGGNAKMSKKCTRRTPDRAQSDAALCSPGKRSPT